MRFITILLLIAGLISAGILVRDKLKEREDRFWAKSLAEHIAKQMDESLMAVKTWEVDEANFYWILFYLNKMESAGQDPSVVTVNACDIAGLTTEQGGLVRESLRENYEKAKKFLNRLEIFTLAESLGGVESLASLPASMTHASFPLVRRQELGMTDSLVRVAVGIEDCDDLINDLRQALRK